ncbi:MAG: DUF177 domain-containing protein [Alphaproteobacteria bacterium]|nr:DUF177 domain-containing protein [Alphaproteobacteria bacterium]
MTKDTQKTPDSAPELSEVIEVDEIPSKGLQVLLKADTAQREALARRFDILSVNSLSADCRLSMLAGGPMVRLQGTILAVVEQSCVVTQAPLKQSLSVPFSLEFAPPSMVEENVELTLADADPPDVILEGKIDVGEAVAQQLALALDPYPRQDGVDLDQVLDALPAGRKALLDRSERENPFAALAGLSKSKGQDDE